MMNFNLMKCKWNEYYSLLCRLATRYPSLVLRTPISPSSQFIIERKCKELHYHVEWVYAYHIRWIVGGNLIWWINHFIISEWLVDFILANAIVFYIHRAIKKNLSVFNLIDFHNSPNCQNKFYTKFSSYTVCVLLEMYCICKIFWGI